MMVSSIYRSVPPAIGAVILALVAQLGLAAAPTTTLLPVVPGTPETRSTPFIAWFGDLGKLGYVEEEYLVSGDANVYEYVDDAAESPDVQVVNPQVPYTTRILVRRPEKPRQFNGTLFLEILNPTAGWDGDPIWNNAFNYIPRSGAAWVGVSSKPVAVDFLRDSWGSPPFALRNNSRYASLSMPFFGQVWDILAQIGTLLKAAGDPNNPMAEFDVRRIILVGYSQSVAYQITFANSFHERTRLPDGSPVVDGYYVAAGGSSAKIVNLLNAVPGPFGVQEGLALGDARNLLMVNAPVVRFQTQTEVVSPAFGFTFTVRQTESDFPLVRTYEMAGGAHVDVATGAVGGVALNRDLGFPPFGAGCGLPINPINIGLVQSALLEVTDQWVRGADFPPPSRLFNLDLSTVPAIVVDDDGNAVGGVRPPTIEVPLGRYVGNNTGGGFCFLFGGFDAFSDAEVASRYGSHGQYVRRVSQEATRAVGERFLLQPDARTLRNDAAQSAIGK